MKLIRIIAGGVAGALAWFSGITVIFGPVQAILADPAQQSAKFLAAFAEPPLPRMAEGPEVLLAGLFVVALIHASVYAWLEGKLAGNVLGRGLAFGLVAWALMGPWFEFYLPWNVMREPLPLVLLELFCWLVVQLLVGIAIASAFRLLRERAT
jgi:hypothetical protein